MLELLGFLLEFKYYPVLILPLEGLSYYTVIFEEVRKEAGNTEHEL